MLKSSNYFALKLNLAQQLLKRFGCGYTLNTGKPPAVKRERTLAYGEVLRSHFAQQALAKHQARQIAKRQATRS